MCVCILFAQLFASCLLLLAVVSFGTDFYLPVRWRRLSKPTCLLVWTLPCSSSLCALLFVCVCVHEKAVISVRGRGEEFYLWFNSFSLILLSLCQCFFFFFFPSFPFGLSSPVNTGSWGMPRHCPGIGMRQLCKLCCLFLKPFYVLLKRSKPEMTRELNNIHCLWKEGSQWQTISLIHSDLMTDPLTETAFAVTLTTNHKIKQISNHVEATLTWNQVSGVSVILRPVSSLTLCSAM